MSRNPFAVLDVQRVAKLVTKNWWLVDKFRPEGVTSCPAGHGVWSADGFTAWYFEAPGGPSMSPPPPPRRRAPPFPVVGICIVCGARLVLPTEAVRCEPCQAIGAWPPRVLVALAAAAGDAGPELPAERLTA